MKKLTMMIAVVGLMLSTALYAQTAHEFSIYAGGGISTLKYSVTTGEQKMGLGGHAGLGYTFFFSPNWGLGTGVELSLYNSKFNLSSLTNQYRLIDISDTEGHGELEFTSALNNYEEKQKAYLLQIPLMLQFQSNGNHKFYAAAGAKVGFPISASYKASARLDNSGYYAYENYTYTTQLFRGFGSANKSSDNDLSFKTSFFASVEAGMKWRLSDNMSLYTGAYLDYGLNNVRKEQSAKQFVEYNAINPEKYEINSVVYAQYTEPGKNPRIFTDKLSLLAAGIKLRLTFGIGSKKAAPAPAPAPAPVVDHERLAREAAERAEAERLAREAAEKAAAERAEAERLAREKAEAERLAREKAAAARKLITDQIAQPIDTYTLSQTTLTNKQKQELDKRIALLQANPDMNVRIVGHTCEIGGDAINTVVGKGRAEKAREYMISKGIEASRIVDLGNDMDRKPVVPNTSENNRKLNRRVEIIVVN